MAERKKGIDTARVSQRCLAGFFVAMFFLHHCLTYI